ncbi:Aspartokinase [Candidatus Syntrophocurvum alkaliphilum]|uniref:Aspartokinase n=1 Tax=Candidatus Syntrophocurvum alkaliphilum TaxID=2293317 RepID=A0A6I6DFH1_9FIRM|nr:aspartate kinase [Candidatus Syntrophocurvum alkaliphilum]QGT99827.1 Aspartokinase [Candidatus Syntrophocurvum alkaliphilum]
MGLIVKKFGGSSVSSMEQIKNIATRVKQKRENGNQVVVVVSAMGDTTDELIQLASFVGSDLSSREMDMLLATGEQQSASLLALTLQSMDCSAVSLTGWQAGIQSDSSYSRARITDITTSRILKELNNDKVVVIAGFQGISPEDDITTLGRGGSDTTAVALAASLNADECIIFTDVEGIYTADPRIVKNASKLKSICYEEMLEMSSLGAVVLQPRAVEFAMLYNVDVKVQSSFNNNSGTVLTEVSKMEKQRVVSGVAHDINCAKVALYDVADRPGIARDLFTTLANNGINVDMVVQSANREDRNDIAFTIESDELERALPVVNILVNELGASGMSYGDKVAKVSIVGAGMQSNPGIAAAMFEALAEENINIHMISTSEIKVSCIIDEEVIEKAVNALHNKFELDNIK